jgi:hypothetical protein
VRYVTTFALGKWILAFIDLWTAFPERTLQRTLESLQKKYPDIRNLIYVRFSRRIDALSQEIVNLLSDTGERWETNDRLQTANDICDGCHHIGRYVATSTDAPYLPSPEIKDFYARQARKLPRDKSLRLLVYDIEQLVRELNSTDRFTNIRAFHRLHLDHGLKLRYWPHSVVSLNARLASIVRLENPLVDFGVVNDQIVFGQALDSTDTNIVTGRGRVTVESGEARLYLTAFENLWRETAQECFPAAQLVVLALLCEMRFRMRSYRGPAGEIFFNEVIARIRAPESRSLIAVDIAPDMAVWWRESEYMQFLNSTIEAARAGNTCSRMFVFRRRFGTKGEAEVFINQVIKPQVEVGVEVGMVFIESLLTHDVGVADFILDGSGWGFYLLPGDRFKKDDVAASRNLACLEMKPDLERIHGNVKTFVSECGWLLPGQSTIDERSLAAWLIL